MKKTYSNRYLKKGKEIREIVEKRYNVLIVLVSIIMCFLICNLFYVQIVKNSYYQNQVKQLTKNVVYSQSTPRGRIYDRNGRLIVDNEAVKIIFYKKPNNVTLKEEINVSYKVADLINVDYSKNSSTNIKKFWVKKNADLAKQKITAEEWKLLEERKISLDAIENYKIERVTEEDLKDFTETDYKAAYIYYLMNVGYSYDEKIIKKESVTEEEYSTIAENLSQIPGFNVKLDWKRVYPYGNTFKVILGNVSTNETGIPYELKDHYLGLGYSLNDRVGTSYLEYQYESILKGNKSKYQILDDGTFSLLEEGSRGNDIVLSIDIELQKEIENIIIEELVATKKEPNTKYYNRSFVVISNPNTGEILAMAGKQIVLKGDSYEIYDYTPGVVTSPVAVGSIIKGAGHIVGYNTGALKIGEVRDDTCLKIAGTPLKCTWTNLNSVDDITALKHSSNVYQFKTAINVGRGKYEYDKPLNLDLDAFDIYRNTFNEFGLGIKTGIDLPVESLGYIGTSRKPGLLLDFTIGHYDTYTPIQLSQYINTIANNGSRLRPYLLKAVYKPTKDGLTDLVSETKPDVLNKLNTKQEYIDRVKLGFIEVLKGGTGYGYVDLKYKPAGKTGTSDSFLDSDNDGTIDTETRTKTFGAYAPYDNPQVSFVVVSPDLYYYEGKTSYQTNVNQRIARRISQKYFDMYK